MFDVLEKGRFRRHKSRYTLESSNEYKIEMLTKRNNFSLWQRNMKDVLVQKGLKKGLYGKSKKPTKISDEAWEELEEKNISVICLTLHNIVLSNNMGIE